MLLTYITLPLQCLDEFLRCTYPFNDATECGIRVSQALEISSPQRQSVPLECWGKFWGYEGIPTFTNKASRNSIQNMLNFTHPFRYAYGYSKCYKIFIKYDLENLISLTLIFFLLSFLDMPQLRRLIGGFPPRQPVFDLRWGHMIPVVDKVALGQVFFKYFGFLCQFSFHWLLQIYYSPYYL
jgi:hypothetical protein